MDIAERLLRLYIVYTIVTEANYKPHALGAGLYVCIPMLEPWCTHIDVHSDRAYRTINGSVDSMLTAWARSYKTQTLGIRSRFLFNVCYSTTNRRLRFVVSIRTRLSAYVGRWLRVICYNILCCVRAVRTTSWSLGPHKCKPVVICTATHGTGVGVHVAQYSSPSPTHHRLIVSFHIITDKRRQ